MTKFRAMSAAVVAALVWVTPSFAADVKEDLHHAKYWLEKADRDYDGHRAKAVEEVKSALKALGLNPNGDPTKIPTQPIHEKQWKSDDQLKHARSLLKNAEKRLASSGDEKHQKALVAIGKAVEQLDAALKVR